MVLVAVRELRLLLGLVFLLFLTSEVWRFVGRLDAVRLVAFVGVIVAVTVVLAIVGLRRTLPPAMGRRRLRMATTRVIEEVLAFGLSLGLTLVVVGVLTMDRELVAEWSGAAPSVLWTWSGGEWRFDLTPSLVQVGAFLGSISMAAFVLEVLTDEQTRHTLVGDLIEPRGGERVSP